MKATLFPNKNNPTLFDVIVDNGVVLGQAYTEVDGYLVFRQDEITNAWSAVALRMAADALDAANLDWDTQVRKHSRTTT